MFVGGLQFLSFLIPVPVNFKPDVYDERSQFKTSIHKFLFQLFVLFLHEYVCMHCSTQREIYFKHKINRIK